MYLKRLQNDLYELFKNSGIGMVLLPISKILLLVYPIYLLLRNFSFLDPVTNIIAVISSILYVAYIIGLLINFAEDNMIMVAVAFALRTLSYIVGIVMHSFSINSVIYIVLYASLASWALYKSNL